MSRLGGGAGPRSSCWAPVPLHRSASPPLGSLHVCVVLLLFWRRRWVSLACARWPSLARGHTTQARWTVLPLLPQAPGQASADTPQGLSMGTTSRGDKPTTRPQLRGRHCPLGATRWEPGMAKHPLGSRGAALSTPHTGAPARLRRAGVDETLVGGMAGGQMAAPTSRPAGIWLGSGQLTPQALQGPNLSALGSGQLLSGAHGGRAWVCYSSPRQVDMGPPSAALCHSQRDGLFQGLCGLIWPLRPPPWHSGDGR